MQKYQIKKNRSDWRPRDPFKIFTDFDTVTFSCIAHESMRFDYVDPKTGKVDQDWRDWKKIGGVSFAGWRDWLNIFLHDRDAVHFTNRWNVDLKVMEYAVYVNEGGDWFVFEKPYQVLRTIFGTKVSMQIKKIDLEKYEARLYVDSKGPGSVNPFLIYPRRRFPVYALSGAWYGGKNNSPGPYGGRAPKDMTMQKSVEIK